MKALICFIISSTLVLERVEARGWTNLRGQAFEADYVSSDGQTVTLRAGGKDVPYPLAQLSPADRDFVKETLARTATPIRKGLLKDYVMHTSMFPTPAGHFAEPQRQAVLKAFSAGAYKPSNPGNAKEWLMRDPAVDLCMVYVPASYDGTKPYGVYVHISPGNGGDFPAAWHPVFDEMRMIAVCARSAGNDTPMMRRVMLSMDALATVRKDYRIDAGRVVVGGLSGGGHMAMLSAAMYPDVFKGTISHAAQSYLGSQGTGSHFPGLTVKSFRTGPRAKMKWIVISGDKDKNYAEIQKTSKQWLQEKLDYRFLDVPGMGHANAAPDKLKEALLWIGM